MTTTFKLTRRPVKGDGAREDVKGGFADRDAAWAWYEKNLEQGRPVIDNINFLHGVEPEAKGESNG